MAAILPASISDKDVGVSVDASRALVACLEAISMGGMFRQFRCTNNQTIGRVWVRGVLVMVLLLCVHFLFDPDRMSV